MSNANRDNYLNLSLNAVERCSQRVISFLEGEERTQALDKLSVLTEAYCMLEERAAISASSIEAAKATLEGDGNGEDSSFEQTYNAQFVERERNIMNMKTHAKFIKFDKSVKAALARANDEESQGDSDDDGDDELRVTEAEVNTVDPISQQTMVSPVKNKHCGHSYEKTTILQMLRTKKRMRCPYVGCPSTERFGPDDLEEDEKLKRILKRQQTK